MYARGGVRALVPHLRGEPDFEPLSEGIRGSGSEPVDVEATDPDGVAVQIGPDDL